MSMNTGAYIADVYTFGAHGNGRDVDTAAIQAAIDACAARGGGQVLLRAGIFLTGTVRLRSHVTLHLTSSAVLLGSPDINDYQIDARQHYAPGIIGPVLVFAEDCEHVGITGSGTINGNGASFPRAMAVLRPVMVRFRDCQHVIMRNCMLRDGSSWAVHAVGCQDVRFEDLSIDNLLHATSDGLDIDGCEQVFVSRCAIASGDDSIALKATQPGRPCRDIVISDCHLRSYCQALRVGPESLAEFARIVVSNCIIQDTGMGGICLQVSHGGVMRELLFDNIVMDNVCNPISVRLGGWRDGDDNVKPWFLDDSRWAEGQLTDVRFSNIRARVPRYYLEGTAK
ncbi:MAG: glycosyl hydrolase family 28 protein, partial [bacterium]